MKTPSIRFAFQAIALSGVVAGAVIACSSSEEAAPQRAVTPPPVPTATVDAGEDSGPPITVLPDGGTVVCTKEDGCFDHGVCEPSLLTDYLNACEHGSCTPFDNAARIKHPDFVPGQALPPVP